MNHKIGSAPDPAPPEPRPSKAFRYMGYRGFSTFLAADNDALVVRKFGTLHARALLMLQDEIVQLEDKLAEIDRQCEEHKVDEADEYLFHNGTFRGDRLWNKERNALMHRLVEALDQYDRFVLNYSRLNLQPKAPQRTIKSIRSWLKAFPQAITEYETGFLKEEKEEDLVAMVERRKSPLRSMLESMRWFRHSKPFRMHNRNEYIRNYADSNAIYYNDDKIDIAITSIILFLGLVMLLVPSWWLNLAESHTTRLAIITVFIATFLGLLLLVTPSKPFETMAGTAAYGALLMVFMQS
ncbi:hypothetical protein BFW01_g2030 [Lasiodiplodia theobromae]|nr:hypothetical protein BFW01_g2030 [Lasiodiplodia theobromae]